MLKPMQTKKSSPNQMYVWGLVALLVISGIVVLVFAFRGNETGEDEVNAVYTNAAATVAAQQLTLEASAPSATPTTQASPTPAVTITAAASPTLFATLASSGNPSGSTGGSTAVGCNNSIFVSDVTFPDNTVVTPGQTFTKTWKLQNTGTCAWTATFKVSPVSGSAMGGVATPIGVTVQPGGTADISVAMTAPATAGDASGYWILTNDEGQNFGQSFYVLVKVGAASTTGTATATATTAVSAPTAANNPDITLSCTLGGTGGTQYEHAGTLTWEDKSDNETGFNVYMNSTLLATLAANTTSFTVQSGTFFDGGTVSTFSVEAFNTGGKATQAAVSKTCP